MAYKLNTKTVVLLICGAITGYAAAYVFRLAYISSISQGFGGPMTRDRFVLFAQVIRPEPVFALGFMVAVWSLLFYFFGDRRNNDVP
jgi:hypothetical protein